MSSTAREYVAHKRLVADGSLVGRDRDCHGKCCSVDGPRRQATIAIQNRRRIHGRGLTLMASLL